MRSTHCVPFIAAALLASAAAARADVCFTVFDTNNRTLYQSRTTPIDMSRQIGDTLYARFPTASGMVFGRSDTCEEIRAPVPGVVTVPVGDTVRVQTAPGMRPPRADRG